MILCNAPSYVAINATHVTVGHDRPAAAPGGGAGAALETVAFAAATSPALLDALRDPARYPAAPAPTVTRCGCAHRIYEGT